MSLAGSVSSSVETFTELLKRLKSKKETKIPAGKSRKLKLLVQGVASLNAAIAVLRGIELALASEQQTSKASVTAAQRLAAKIHSSADVLQASGVVDLAEEVGNLYGAAFQQRRHQLQKKKEEEDEKFNKLKELEKSTAIIKALLEQFKSVQADVFGMSQCLAAAEDAFSVITAIDAAMEQDGRGTLPELLDRLNESTGRLLFVAQKTRDSYKFLDVIAEAVGRQRAVQHLLHQDSMTAAASLALSVMRQLLGKFTDERPEDDYGYVTLRSQLSATTGALDLLKDVLHEEHDPELKRAFADVLEFLSDSVDNMTRSASGYIERRLAEVPSEARAVFNSLQYAPELSAAAARALAAGKSDVDAAKEAIEGVQLELKNGHKLEFNFDAAAAAGVPLDVPGITSPEHVEEAQQLAVIQQHNVYGVWSEVPGVFNLKVFDKEGAVESFLVLHLIDSQDGKTYYVLVAKGFVLDAFDSLNESIETLAGIMQAEPFQKLLGEAMQI